MITVKKNINREQLLAYHQMLCKAAYDLMILKNADYAGRNGKEPFANFTRCESMGFCLTEQGILTRMCDKMSRFSSFIESGDYKVKEESMLDTGIDLINYSVLLISWLAAKHGWDLESRFSQQTENQKNTGRNPCSEIELPGELSLFAARKTLLVEEGHNGNHPETL